ncbi:MAG TPA: phospholipase D family protein [Albitalea sp.]|nr:phospholipase D family protein [Albitalea sp.]
MPTCSPTRLLRADPWAPGRRLAAWLLGLAFALLAGCTSLPKVDREAIASSAIGISPKTTLGRIALESMPAKDLSGFRLMPLGTFSYDTRLQLARRAEVSIDAQYYHFEDDESGRYLLRALRDAAERGVRVRLLIDDLYTGGHDPLFLAFAAHKNVEVRLFNPFCCARDRGQAGRFLASVGDWSRVNHRMHNKMFIVDGAMAVFGGRNVANEYFLRSDRDANFIDVDAFAVGFIVAPMQALFDRYWNSDPVYPLEALARTDLSKEQLRAQFEERTGPAHTPPPAPLPPNDILGYGPLADDLDGGRLGLIWGNAYVFADYPDKPFETGDDLLETSATYNAFEAIRRAKSEVVATSPYLVPGQRGLALIREMRARGVKLVLMTNSLGSTDEPVVHLGYSRYREEMLKLGVDLYELSALRVKKNKRSFLFGSSLGRLHAKLVVIDRKTLFVGSMNLDPRSAITNTEFGAVIESPELARELLRVIDIDRLQSAYRVRLAPQGGGLQWLSIEDDEEVIRSEEPEASPWVKIELWLLTHIVPERLL